MKLAVRGAALISSCDVRMFIFVVLDAKLLFCPVSQSLLAGCPPQRFRCSYLVSSGLMPVCINRHTQSAATSTTKKKKKVCVPWVQLASSHSTAELRLSQDLIIFSDEAPSQQTHLMADSKLTLCHTHTHTPESCLAVSGRLFRA